WYGKQGGAVIKREIWEGIRDYYVRTQKKGGEWDYLPQGNASGSSLTMTEAGVCGLLIAAMELNSDREIDNGDGSFGKCGQYEDDKNLKLGMGWLARPGSFQIAEQPIALFYNLYGIERVGRLSGERFIGRYDWYREGCKWLVRNQHEDGSWHARSRFDQ